MMQSFKDIEKAKAKAELKQVYTEAAFITALAAAIIALGLGLLYSLASLAYGVMQIVSLI